MSYNVANSETLQGLTIFDGGTVIKQRAITGASATIDGSTEQLVTVNFAGAVALALSTTNLVAGSQLLIKDISGLAGTNNITLTPSSGSIESTAGTGAGSVGATYVINTNFGSVVLEWNGTNFYVLGDGKVNIPLAQRGVASGVATLDGTGKVPVAQLPASVVGGLKFQGTVDMSTDPGFAAPSAANQGFMYQVSVASPGAVSYANFVASTFFDVNDYVVSNGSGAAWEKIDNTDSVRSVAGKVGVVTLVSADITDATAAATASVIAKRDASGGAAFGTSTPIVGALTASQFKAEGLVTHAAALVEKLVTDSTASYTVLATDRIVVLTFNGARTLNLPSTPTTGRVLTIKEGGGFGGGTKKITITPAAGNIDGAANFSTQSAYASTDVVFNGSEWSVI